MKSQESKSNLLENLKRMPIVQIACEKSSTSRASYYRWRNEDENFRKEADVAIAEGEALITDMSESQLITMVRDRNFQAVQLWLKHHHPKYSTKVELTGNLKIEDEPLSPEQQELVENALKLADLQLEKSGAKNQNEDDATTKQNQ